MMLALRIHRMGWAAGRRTSASNVTVVARLFALAMIPGVALVVLLVPVSADVLPVAVVVVLTSLAALWLIRSTINRAIATRSSRPAAQPASALSLSLALPRPAALPRPLAELAVGTSSHRERQCPHCGGFAALACRDRTTFECSRCGHNFAWRPKTPWPDVVLRPALAARDAND
jgi:ribosomal protein L37AE/L43A